MSETNDPPTPYASDSEDYNVGLEGDDSYDENMVVWEEFEGVYGREELEDEEEEKERKRALEEDALRRGQFGNETEEEKEPPSSNLFFSKPFDRSAPFMTPPPPFSSPITTSANDDILTTIFHHYCSFNLAWSVAYSPEPDTNQNSGDAESENGEQGFESVNPPPAPLKSRASRLPLLTVSKRWYRLFLPVLCQYLSVTNKAKMSEWRTHMQWLANAKDGYPLQTLQLRDLSEKLFETSDKFEPFFHPLFSLNSINSDLLTEIAAGTEQTAILATELKEPLERVAFASSLSRVRHLRLRKWTVHSSSKVVQFGDALAAHLTDLYIDQFDADEDDLSPNETLVDFSSCTRLHRVCIRQVHIDIVFYNQITPTFFGTALKELCLTSFDASYLAFEPVIRRLTTLETLEVPVWSINLFQNPTPYSFSHLRLRISGRTPSDPIALRISTRRCSSYSNQIFPGLLLNWIELFRVCPLSLFTITHLTIASEAGFSPFLERYVDFPMLKAVCGEQNIVCKAVTADSYCM